MSYYQLKDITKIEGKKMKKEAVIAIVVLIGLVLGVQTYMLFQLNDQIKVVNGQDNTSPFQVQDPLQKKPDLTIPKSIPDAEFFKDQPWSLYEEMQRMQNEMQQLFSDSYSRFHLNMPLGDFSKIPEVDLQEKPDQYIVTINAPGINLSSLVVKIENQVLHISIKTEHVEDQANNKNGAYRFREPFTGELHRDITLPGPVNVAKLDTSYNNGILMIKIPKT